MQQINSSGILYNEKPVCPISVSRIVLLQPVTKTFPNPFSLYFPNKLQPVKKISIREFLEKYANYPRKIRVCFDDTLSVNELEDNFEEVTAYSYGLDSWYILV